MIVAITVVPVGARYMGGFRSAPDDVVADDDDILAACADAVSRHHDRAPGAMTRVALAPCSPFSVTEDLMVRTAELAEQLDVRLHTHFAENAEDDEFSLATFGCRPMEYLERTGWCTDRTWVAHCVMPNDDEIRRLGAAGVGAAHCPSSNLILASGIEDELPDMPQVHDAIRRGIVRLCSICDGYEVRGEDVAVYGEAENAIGHAVFLRTFTDRVTVIVHGQPDACEQAVALAGHYGIRVVPDHVESMQLTDDERIEVATGQGERIVFDLVYPSLGSVYRSALAQQLGARCDDNGSLLVDDHQRTSVDGVYAIGDVVSGLKQMSVATGHAAIASTAVHNSLEANPWGGSRQEPA